MDEAINQIHFLMNIVTLTDGCIKRPSVADGDDDGHYCVCNATYCDQAPDAIKPLNPAEYILITSSKSGLRFHVSNGVFENKISDSKYLNLPGFEITSFFQLLEMLRNMYENSVISD